MASYKKYQHRLHMKRQLFGTLIKECYRGQNTGYGGAWNMRGHLDTLATTDPPRCLFLPVWMPLRRPKGEKRVSKHHRPAAQLRSISGADLVCSPAAGLSVLSSPTTSGPSGTRTPDRPLLPASRLGFLSGSMLHLLGKDQRG